MKPRIILAVRDKKRRDFYLSQLDPIAVCEVLDQLNDIPTRTGKIAFNGLIIDLPMYVKATYMEKVHIDESLHAMPSAVINFKERCAHILMIENRYGSAKTLESLITVCTVHRPKVVYPRDRVDLHLNARLSTSRPLPISAERTCTMNVSKGGCFMYTVDSERFEPGMPVYFEFPVLKDRNLIIGTVRWKREWGTTHSAPGIGISFESIGEGQLLEIESIIADRKIK